MKEESKAKLIGLGGILLATAFTMLSVYLIAWSASKGWNKGEKMK